MTEMTGKSKLFYGVGLFLELLLAIGVIQASPLGKAICLGSLAGIAVVLAGFSLHRWARSRSLSCQFWVLGGSMVVRLGFFVAVYWGASQWFSLPAMPLLVALVGCYILGTMAETLVLNRLESSVPEVAVPTTVVPATALPVGLPEEKRG